MTALNGVRVIEIANERVSLAGKLLADMGAEVILVEPPGGDPSRGYPPFVDQDPTQPSLHFLHYNTNKKSVVLDLEKQRDAHRYRQLVAGADVVLEAEPTTRLKALGLDYVDFATHQPQLIHVALTPFGRKDPRSDLPQTDLTLMAAGGPPWSCGYDDHGLPPVRGWGDQAHHTGSHFACMSILTALLARNAGHDVSVG